MFKRKSFFERLTGAVKVDDDYGEEYEEGSPEEPVKEKEVREERSEEGQLPVDVYQTPGEIIIKAMIAGVKPEDLDVSITRDIVTIKGKREPDRGISEEDYFHRELYWGGFSRTILLPQEIEIEEAEAIEKHGLLIVRLPKIDKERQAKLKVKNG